MRLACSKSQKKGYDTEKLAKIIFQKSIFSKTFFAHERFFPPLKLSSPPKLKNNSAPRVDFDGTTRGALRILNDVIGH